MSEDILVVDARGLICPEPVMMLHSAVRDTHVRGLIKILATDPASKKDVEKFCHFLNHKLIESNIEKDGEGEGELFTFIIRKGGF